MTQPRPAHGRFGKDFYGGGLILLLGLLIAYQAVSYRIGTLSAMGPGFFPLALGIILAVCGVLIAGFGSSQPAGPHVEHGGVDLRGWCCIILGIISFIVVGEYGGLVPATFAIVFLSALGDRGNTLLSALLLAVVMVGVCVGVFWWGLQLQLPLFQWGG